MKLTEGLSVIRMAEINSPDLRGKDLLENTTTGYLVYYDSIQHHYKECHEHGNTLEEAIELMESKNGR